MEIIPVAELKIGMFVVEPDCPWSEFSFALQGFVVSRPEQVVQFREKCRFVQIDRSRSLEAYYVAPKVQTDRPLKAKPLVTAASAVEAVPRQAAPLFAAQQVEQQRRRRKFLDFLQAQEDDEALHALNRELGRIEPRYDALVQSLQSSFQSIASDRYFDINGVREGVRDLAGSLQRNPDALMWLLRLKGVDQYSFDHAMDVSVHLLLLGTQVGWRGPHLVDLGLAGMLQDVGKAQVSADLLAKCDPLSVAEQELIRSHVASSLEILTTQTQVSTEVLQIVSRHHERRDGSGYPRGLQEGAIGIGAEMAGLVDSFCAMLKNKPYRTAIGHQQALEELFNLRGRQFNAALMEQFVQCVGLYPIGTLVELSTGEVGVVIQQNRVQRSRPRVLLMLDAAKEMVSGYRVVDLREPASAAIRVSRALPHDAYGLDRHEFYLG